MSSQSSLGRGGSYSDQRSDNASPPGGPMVATEIPAKKVSKITAARIRAREEGVQGADESKEGDDEADTRRKAAGYTSQLDHVEEIGGAANNEEAALIVLKYVKESLDKMVGMVHNYNKMFNFLCFITVFLAVVALQNNLGGGAVKMYGLLKNEMFADSVAFIEDGGVPSSTLPAKNDFYDWLETKVLSSIFRDPQCGNGNCESPEEYPTWRAAADAREFVGCSADCGRAETAKYTVDFFDTVKLTHAYAAVSDALDNGWDGGAAYDYGVKTAEGKVTHPPAAGWNVCSVDKKEFGFFEEVYRTKELDKDSSGYGGLKEIDLFAGEWELRIAYANFTWPSRTRGGRPSPVAFPAVRGRICEGDRDAIANTTCTVFSPCEVELDPEEGSATCRSEFFQGKYYDFSKEGDWRFWADKYLPFVTDANTDWIAAWLGFSDVYKGSLTDEEKTAHSNALIGSLGDDDGWANWKSGGCAMHTVWEKHDWGGGWGEAELYIQEVETGRIVYQPPEDAGGGGMEYSGWSNDAVERPVILCVDKTYVMKVDTPMYPRPDYSWKIWNAEIPRVTRDEDPETINSNGYTYVKPLGPFIREGFQGEQDWCPLYGTSLLGGTCDRAVPVVANTCTTGKKHKITRHLSTTGVFEMNVKIYDVSSASDPKLIFDETNSPFDGNSYDQFGDTVRLCDASTGEGEIPYTIVTRSTDVNAYYAYNMQDPQQCNCASTGDTWCGDCVRIDVIDESGGVGVESLYRFVGAEETACPLYGYTSGTSCNAVIAAVGTVPTMKPTASMSPSLAPTPKPTATVPPPEPPVPGAPSPSPTTDFGGLTGGDGTGSELSELRGLWGNRWNPMVADKYAPITCEKDLIGNAICDNSNNNMFCDFDGGDCCPSTCVKSAGGVECDTKMFANEATAKCRDPINLSHEAGGKHKDSWPFFTESTRQRWREGAGLITPALPALTDAEASDPPAEYVRKFIRYPYSLSTLFLKMLKDKYGPEYADAAYLPSLACPDCEAYGPEKPYKSHTFAATTVHEVEEDDASATATASLEAKTASPEMFPSLGSNRERHFVVPNLVLGGVMLRQERVRLGDCESIYFEDTYGRECPIDSTSTRGFGVDPTYLSTSSLYRKTNYDTLAETYEEYELNEKGVPFGFLFTQSSLGEAGKEVEDFPVLFDINMNVTRIADVLTYLKDGNYIDEQTNKLTVDLVLFNQPQGILALVGAELSPRGAGGYKFQYSIDLLDTVLYDTGGTLTLDNTDKVRWVLEQAFFVMLLYFMLVEVYELFEMGVSAGDPLAYFKSAGNAVDLFAYGLQFIAVEMWFRYVRLCENLDPELHWSVYTDYFATARYFEATKEMADFQEFVAELKEATTLKTNYTVVCALVILSATFQVLKNINFHPRLGIVTRTIAKAAADLTFFLLLFCTVGSLYAFLGCLIFGQEMDRFSSFALAFEAVLQMCVGMYSPMDEPEFLGGGKKLLAMLYFWTYVAISFFILLNALLAIVVEAYDLVKQQADLEAKMDPLWFMLYENFVHAFWPSRTYIRMVYLAKLLDDTYAVNVRDVKSWRVGCMLAYKLKRGKFPARQSLKLLVVPKEILSRRFATIIIDQDAVAAAIEVMLPDAKEASIDIMAYNVLEFLGTSGIDKDGDGKLSDLEIMAFKDSQGLEVGPNAVARDKTGTEEDEANARRGEIRVKRMQRLIAAQNVQGDGDDSE